MKINFRIGLALCGLAFSLIGSAGAQSKQSRLKVTIPFNFTIGDTNLDAGDYTVEKLPSSAALLTIRSVQNRTQLIVRGIPMESLVRGGDPRLQFAKYANRYFLSQVWFAGGESGDNIPKGRFERELDAERNLKVHTIVLALAR